MALMNLTVTQWRELEALKQTAMTALQAVGSKALDLAMATDDSETRKYLANGYQKVFEAEQDLAVFDVHVVDEWTGGETSKLREPQGIGLGRHYFADDGTVSR